MILTCPQCATRYQTDAAKFQPSGRNVRCAKCGHLWHQEAPSLESDATSDVAVVDDMPPPPEPMASRPAGALGAAVSRDNVRMVTPPEQASRLPGQLATAAGWIALIALILLIGWAATAFRQQIATVWPQSASLYAALGMKTNATGIDIKDVTFEHKDQDGQNILLVSGTLDNRTTRELPVPQIRVALIDEEKHELYHWTFAPGVMTLAAGQTSKFSTRLTDPPAGARRFELRFAKAGE